MYINMENCEKIIKNGMTVRYIVTIITFYFLSLNTEITKYIFDITRCFNFFRQCG